MGIFVSYLWEGHGIANVERSSQSYGVILLGYCRMSATMIAEVTLFVIETSVIWISRSYGSETHSLPQPRVLIMYDFYQRNLHFEQNITHSTMKRRLQTPATLVCRLLDKSSLKHSNLNRDADDK